MNKIAIITSHPIQYYAPWFRYLTQETDLDIKVFYLWDFGVTQQTDQGFQQSIQWDIPLLEGYSHEFIPNVSSDPGTHHFWGFQNPTLLSKVKDYKPDAVLLMCYNYASLYHFIWSWKSQKSPLIFRGDSHRLLPRKGAKEWVRRQLISWIYQRFSAYLYVGRANYDYYLYHNVAPQNLFFSPHTVDNQRFIVRREEAIKQAKIWKQQLGIPENHQIILFAGKFESKKRPLDLLQAFLKANLAQVALLFVGSGTLENELKSQAAAHSNVYFAPFQNQSQMPRTYAIADVFVLPSWGGWETWGLAINEAMCSACPVIVSDHVGCAKDLVHPYRNGLVFPAGDVAQLSICLQESFSNVNRLNQWGNESQKIISHYTYEQATHGLQEALASLKFLASN
ncbi:MAG: glycosyltransferase family 4 protein [Microcoleaceae cyanobacterium]